MAYWGYFPIMKKILEYFEIPHVLEIGVDKGQTLLPLVHYLSLNNDSFSLVGCDVLVRTELKVVLNQMRTNLKENQLFSLFEKSSLELLPEVIESHPEEIASGGLFSLILIDGDHNYYTVKKELDFANQLLYPHGVIIFDDYAGRWSHKDEYFSELKEYKDKNIGTPVQHTEKKGVKPAVDEFLENNPDWVMSRLLEEYEPVLLFRKNMWIFERYPEQDVKTSDSDKMFWSVKPGPRLTELHARQRKKRVEA